MVTLYKASCPCGFEQDGLRHGYKPDYKIFCFDIHYCDDCKKLFHCWDEDPIHGPPSQTICPDCDEEPIESYSYITDFSQKKHECPKCKQLTLTFTATGEWTEQ